MENKYIGERCIVCGELFEDDQDIVVCPDCGTPYHRKCWNAENKCVNTKLHENGESWASQPKAHFAAPPPPETAASRCIRCGTENAPGQRFCGECGMPLIGQNGESPFEKMDDKFSEKTDGSGFGAMPGVQTIRLTAQSDLDGIKLGDFFDYIGNRSINIITNFIKFAKTESRVSLNTAAFFFPEFYFFYRRMPKLGMIFLFLSYLLSVPAMIMIGQSGNWGGYVYFTTGVDVSSAEFTMLLDMCQLLDISMMIIAALFANYWYYKQARRDITAIRSTFGEAEPDNTTKEKIRSAGGTSWSAAVGAFAGMILLRLGFLLVMSMIF